MSDDRLEFEGATVRKSADWSAIGFIDYLKRKYGSRWIG